MIKEQAKEALKIALTTLGIIKEDEQKAFFDILDEVITDNTKTENLQKWINKQSIEDQGKKLKDFLVDNEENFKKIDTNLFGKIQLIFQICEMSGFKDNILNFDNSISQIDVDAIINENKFLECEEINVDLETIKNPIQNLMVTIVDLREQVLILNKEKQELTDKIEVYKTNEEMLLKIINNLNQKVKNLSIDNHKLNSVFQLLNKSIDEQKIVYNNALTEQAANMLNATKSLQQTLSDKTQNMNIQKEKITEVKGLSFNK